MQKPNDTTQKRIWQAISKKLLEFNNLESEVENIDLSLLPTDIADFARAIAKQKGIDTNVPVALVFSVLNAVYMPLFEWQVGTNRKMPLSFSCLVIADSSYGKSHVLNEFLEPLIEIQEACNSIKEDNKDAKKIALSAIARRRNKIMAGQAEAPPQLDSDLFRGCDYKNNQKDQSSALARLDLIECAILRFEEKKRFFLRDDLTEASFCDAMRRNERSAYTWYADEASGIFSSSFASGAARFASNFIAMTSNNILTNERTGAEKADISGVAINAIFLIQPMTAEDIFKSQNKNILQYGGFLNRFCIIKGVKKNIFQIKSKEEKKEESQYVHQYRKKIVRQISSVIQIKEKHLFKEMFTPRKINTDFPELSERENHEISKLDRNLLTITTDKELDLRDFEEFLYMKYPSPTDKSLIGKLFLDCMNVASIMFLYENIYEYIDLLSNIQEPTFKLEIPDVYVDNAMKIAFSIFTLKRVFLNDDKRKQDANNIDGELETFARILYEKRHLIKHKGLSEKEQTFAISLSIKSTSSFPRKYRSGAGQVLVRKLATQLAEAGVVRMLEADPVMIVELSLLKDLGML